MLTNPQPIRADMVPATPGTPGPTVPAPEPTHPVPPTPPAPQPAENPVPEIEPLPGSPKPDKPEIEEPEQPGREHKIGFRTYTSGVAGEPLKPQPSGPYGGKAKPDEGMEPKPDTGTAAQPYNANAKGEQPHEPAERTEEANQTEEFPKVMSDESSVKAQDLVQGIDRSDEKSTQGLDRNYNDPEAANEKAT